MKKSSVLRLNRNFPVAPDAHVSLNFSRMLYEMNEKTAIPRILISEQMLFSSNASRPGVIAARGGKMHDRSTQFSERGSYRWFRPGLGCMP